MFHSIQDPVLIVTPQGEIIEVNTATLYAANKQRQQVIGAGVCAIIHGGRWPHIECPLEEFLRTCNGKSENTKLPGLGGEYHLTISPLADEQQNVYALLLRARRLTREESVNVETIRTAQLAAIENLRQELLTKSIIPLTASLISLNCCSMMPARVLCRLNCSAGSSKRVNALPRLLTVYSLFPGNLEISLNR